MFGMPNDERRIPKGFASERPTQERSARLTRLKANRIDLSERLRQRSRVRLLLCAASLLFLGFVRGSLANSVLPLDRWPVQETPIICGRAISQFVIFERPSDRGADKNRSSLRASLGNVFTPVSQDKNGVFYHAMIGVMTFDYNYGRRVVPGGLYVSKTKPNTIFIYFGDARKPGWVLNPSRNPLPMKVLERLRIGHSADGPQKKTPKKNF